MYIKYPPEIQKLIDMLDPYRTSLLKKDFSSIPEEVLKAYDEFKKWAWEQEQ